MRCEDFEAFWEEWLSGAAPPAVEEHLRECAHCREVAEDLRSSSRWLSHARLETPEVSPAFWPRLQEQLEARDAKGDFWAALAWASARMAAGLAVVVLVLAMGVLSRFAEQPVAQFDEPQVYLEEAPGSVPAPTDGRLSRDQVVLTLVAQSDQRR